MERTDVVILLKIDVEDDPLNQQVPVETSRTEIFCQFRSATQTEWDIAAKEGLRADYQITVSREEYSGEQVAIFRGQRELIYRTYEKNSEEIELHLGRKVGV